MAKVTLAPEFESLSGKLCKKSKSTIYHYKKSGKMIRCDYHERQDPNTADQQQVRAKFTARSNAAKTWYAANKPTTAQPNGSADYQKVKAAFDRSNYDNIYSFVISLVAGTVPAVQVPGGTTGGTTTGGGGNPSSD